MSILEPSSSNSNFCQFTHISWDPERPNVARRWPYREYPAHASMGHLSNLFKFHCILISGPLQETNVVFGIPYTVYNIKVTSTVWSRSAEHHPALFLRRRFKLERHLHADHLHCVACKVPRIRYRSPPTRKLLIRYVNVVIVPRVIDIRKTDLWKRNKRFRVAVGDCISKPSEEYMHTASRRKRYSETLMVVKRIDFEAPYNIIYLLRMEWPLGYIIWIILTTAR